MSASERDKLKGSLAKFGFSVDFARFANVPCSKGMECGDFIISPFCFSIFLLCLLFVPKNAFQL
ncbi:MAG: hypothetical protein PHN68_11170, partial [Prolixibacteraceae bacterium]|nr:hypothetical protein [Prolixibacteraceae bacterium]